MFDTLFFVAFIVLPILFFPIWFTISASFESNTKKRGYKKFPEHWKAILRAEVPYYSGLNEGIQKHFEQRVIDFLAEIPIVGERVMMNDRLRLLVSAYATMPTIAFQRFPYPNLVRVRLVHGQIKLVQYQGRYVLGLVKPFRNGMEMVLSTESLEQASKNMNDRVNVGIHEFAHILDSVDGRMDGSPSAFINPSLKSIWTKAIRIEMERIEHGLSDMGENAGINEAEFFAVASEYFFEKPDQFKAKHPQLYAIMRKIFRQDSTHIIRRGLQLMKRGKVTAHRNDTCPCGSGKKFKDCCWWKLSSNLS